MSLIDKGNYFFAKADFSVSFFFDGCFLYTLFYGGFFPFFIMNSLTYVKKGEKKEFFPHFSSKLFGGCEK